MNRRRSSGRHERTPRRSTAPLAVLAGLAVLAAALGGCADHEPERIAIVNTAPTLVGEVSAFTEMIRAERPGIEIVDPGLSTVDQVTDAVDAALASSPDLIVSVTSSAAVEVASREVAIPHVFTSINDPVGVGLVDDLARPGGATTGIGGNPHNAKAVEYLVDVTGATVLAILVDRDDAGSVAGASLATAAASLLGVDAVEIDVDGGDAVLQIDTVDLAHGVDGVVLPANNRLTPRLDEIAPVLESAGLPLAVATTGADPTLSLITVEIDVDRRVRSLVAVVDAVLDGEDPGLIPVVAPEARLTVNRAVAERLGVQIPPALLVLADEIVG